MNDRKFIVLFFIHKISWSVITNQNHIVICVCIWQERVGEIGQIDFKEFQLGTSVIHIISQAAMMAKCTLELKFLR